MAGKERNPQVIEEIAKIVAENPTLPVREIARQVDVPKSTVSRILNRPITLDRVRAKMAESSVSGRTHRTIGSILASLDILVEDMLAAEIREDADITKLLQLLNALSTVAERMARAGITFSSLVPDSANSALSGELRLAFARGLRAALRWPGRAKRTAERIERILVGPPPGVEDAE